MAIQCKAPEPFSLQSDMTKVFLAGSIAEQWQERIWKKLENMDLIVLNPRRDDWDSTFTDEQFVEQTRWEFSGLHSADVIAMYFDANTQSPVTLLELGLFASSGKLVVCCPTTFWKFGNVKSVCKRYNIPLVHSFEEFYDELIIKISKVISL